MAVELKALEDNGTWSIVPLPLNCHVVGCKWIYKVKVNATGEVERYKARDLEEEVYMELPQGYSVQGEYQTSSKLLGFTQSTSDYSLFTMKANNGNFVAILVYVDDILIGSTSAQAASNVKGFLSSQFKLKDLGKVKFFLGLEIAQSPEGISICQRKYTLDFLEEHGLLGTKLVSTPIDYNHKLCKTKGEQKLHDATKYRQLVQKLLYLTFTRLDISYAVQVLSQFMDKPSSEHFMVVYRVMKYLKRAPSQGILMKSKSDMRISAYSDSDWARCPDSRKSITGFGIFIGDSLMSWKSNKQTVVARKSAKAEYRSMALTCCEII
ncbi:PREDICTED: uncharacterized mitochondrial protein AtMg00810-like [Theobroma cacao]|uniref:Uncharacterized mitochondrial protein AtMg00810-like n=1 Tax=Theobroma cacao TaxID=3641 RepID=A0AB32WWV0_THECC|nr:PREDICTED: uncharacterized mitochondrial protein AtMg00810-like [Theobroma cacao]